MAAFSYRALDARGRLVRGILEGDSERQVRAQLRARALRPIQVSAGAGERWPLLGRLRHAARGQGAPDGARLRSAELTLLTRQLATLVQSGMPLAEALAACARQARSARAQGVILQLRARVSEGHGLAAALGQMPRSFSPMYRAMVRAGEHSGRLGPVLERLASYIEERGHLQQKMTAAMLYPLVLVVVAVVVIGLLMVFVVPQLVGVFQHSEVALPWLTRALIALSGWLGQWGGWLLPGVLLALWWLRRWLRRPAPRRRWHGLLLRLPLVGGLVTGLDSARFAATLSMLVAAGVPLLEGLRIACGVLANVVLQAAASDAALVVEEGGSLAAALEASGVFPPLMCQMVASGEASGELQSLLERTALHQERELQMTLSGLMSLLEPLMVVLMAVVVGTIVIAILLPIIEMNNLVI